jgi:hypothetical protein
MDQLRSAPLGPLKGIYTLASQHFTTLTPPNYHS